jgi:hypothetical protein
MHYFFILFLFSFQLFSKHASIIPRRNWTRLCFCSQFNRIMKPYKLTHNTNKILLYLGTQVTEGRKRTWCTVHSFISCSSSRSQKNVEGYRGSTPCICILKQRFHFFLQLFSRHNSIISSRNCGLLTS